MGTYSFSALQRAIWGPSVPLFCIALSVHSSTRMLLSLFWYAFIRISHPIFHKGFACCVRGLPFSVIGVINLMVGTPWSYLFFVWRGHASRGHSGGNFLSTCGLYAGPLLPGPSFKTAGLSTGPWVSIGSRAKCPDQGIERPAVYMYIQRIVYIWVYVYMYIYIYTSIEIYIYIYHPFNFCLVFSWTDI